MYGKIVDTIESKKREKSPMIGTHGQIFQFILHVFTSSFVLSQSGWNPLENNILGLGCINNINLTYMTCFSIVYQSNYFVFLRNRQ